MQVKSVARMAMAAGLLTLASCTPNPREPDPPENTLGTSAEISSVKLRNVYVAAPDGDAYQPGQAATVRLTLINEAGQRDSLLKVTSAAAGGVTLHWDRECDGKAERVDAITLLANGKVVAAGGDTGSGQIRHQRYFLRLEELSTTIRRGTTVPMTFTFSHAGTGTVNVLVQSSHRLDEPAQYACQQPGD